MRCNLRIFCLIFLIICFMETVFCITEDEINKIIEKKMKKVIKKYDRQIALLEERISAQDMKILKLEKKCSTPTLEAEKERGGDTAFVRVMSNRSNETGIERKRQKSSSHGNQERVVTGITEHVAFLAYMSTNEISPSLHHTLVFDVVKTNLGSAYNRHTGVFTVPEDGVYVLSWTIFSYRNSYIFTQIVVNSSAFGSMTSDSDEPSDFHAATKVVVVSLSRGDAVYIRTHPTSLSHGNINSDSIYGESSFCGWKL